MSREQRNRCPRCGADLLKRDQCAHECPHGAPCRFRLDPATLLPRDWYTLECSVCDENRPTAGPLSRAWVPTPAGWEYPLSSKALERLRRWKAEMASE